MIKKGFDLFIPTGQSMEGHRKYAKCYCCSVCQSPYMCLCMIVCKYRSATFGEYIERVLRRENDEKGKKN